MITYSANLQAALRQGFQPTLLIGFETSVGVWQQAVVGRSSTMLYPQLAGSVTPVTTQLDFAERRAQVGQCSLELAPSAWVKWLHGTFRLKGKRCRILFGTADMLEADFGAYFGGVVDKADATPEGGLRVRLADGFSILRDAKIRRASVGEHPAEAVLGLIQAAGVPSSMYDATTFDPTAAQFDDIRTWVMFRLAGSTGADWPTTQKEATPAIKLIEELCLVMDGHLRAGLDGKLALVRRGRSDAPDATLDITKGDIIEDSLEIVEQGDKVANPLNIRVNAEFDDMWHYTTAWDIAAMQALDVAGGGGRNHTREIWSPWFHGSGRMGSAGLPAATGVGGTFTINGFFVCGMSGCRWPTFPTGAPPAGTAPDGTHKLTIDISGGSNAGTGTGETLEVDQVTISTIDRNTLLGNYASTVTMRIASRPDPKDHSVDEICTDMTPHVWLRNRLADRYRYGVDVLSFETDMRFAHLETGDIIALVLPDYVSPDYPAGVDANTTWEIIKRDPLPYGNDLGYKWTVAWWNKAAAPAPAFTYGTTLDFELDAVRQGAPARVTDEFAFTSGCVAATAALLTFTMSAGTIDWGQSRWKMAAATMSVPASRDSYVYFDTKSRGWVIRDTALGAGAPTAYTGHMLRAKIVSDATHTTSATTYALTEKLSAGVATTAVLADGSITNVKVNASAAIDGSKLKEGTGPLTHLSVAGVFDSLANVTTKTLDQISDTATYKRVAAAFVGAAGALDFNAAGWLNKNLDNLADGAMWLKVTGVVANKVTATSITDKAVGTAAIDDGVLEPVHFDAMAVGFNHSFQKWTRG